MQSPPLEVLDELDELLEEVLLELELLEVLLDVLEVLEVLDPPPQAASAKQAMAIRKRLDESKLHRNGIGVSPTTAAKKEAHSSHLHALCPSPTSQAGTRHGEFAPLRKREAIP